MANKYTLSKIQEGTAEFRDYAFAIAEEYSRIRAAFSAIRDAFEECAGKMDKQLFKALSIGALELSDVEMDDDDDGYGD